MLAEEKGSLGKIEAFLSSRSIPISYSELRERFPYSGFLDDICDLILRERVCMISSLEKARYPKEAMVINRSRIIHERTILSKNIPVRPKLKDIEESQIPILLQFGENPVYEGLYSLENDFEPYLIHRENLDIFKKVIRETKRRFIESDKDIKSFLFI